METIEGRKALLRNVIKMHGPEFAPEELFFEVIAGDIGVNGFKALVHVLLGEYISKIAIEKTPGLLPEGTVLGFRVHNPVSGLFMKTGPWGRSWSKTSRMWTTIAHLKSSMTGKFGRPDTSTNKYYLREIEELKQLQVFDISANKLVGSAYDLWQRPAKK